MKQNWESRKDLHTQCSKLKILRFLWFQSYQILGTIFPNLSNQSLVPLVQFKPQLLIFWPLFSLTFNLVSTLPDVSKIDLNMPVLERTVLSLPRGPYPSPQKFSEGSLGPCLFSSWGAVGEGGRVWLISAIGRKTANIKTFEESSIQAGASLLPLLPSWGAPGAGART